MRKSNNRVVLVLTALVIFLGGILPGIIGKIEDFLADDKVYYRELKTVQFFRDLNDTQKLYLLEHGSTASVVEYRAKLKQEDMQEVLETALQPYIEMGYIFAEVGDFTMECEPILYYSNTEANFSAIFWLVEMELWDGWGQSISLYLDDATGKMMLISYECLEPVFEKEFWDYNLEMLCSIYKSSMGWDEVNSLHEKSTEEFNYRNIIHYRRGDIVYGELGIDFIISENGFSIQFE